MSESDKPVRMTSVACMMDRHVAVDGKCRCCGIQMPVEIDVGCDDRITKDSVEWLQSIGWKLLDEDCVRQRGPRLDNEVLTISSADLENSIILRLWEHGPSMSFVGGSLKGDNFPNTKARMLSLFHALGLEIPKVGSVLDCLNSEEPLDGTVAKISASDIHELYNRMRPKLKVGDGIHSD